LTFILSRLELHPVDRSVASLAAVLGARYRLRAADAVHLATAVTTGADRFIANNRRDFDREHVVEIDVTYRTCGDSDARRGSGFCPHGRTRVGADEAPSRLNPKGAGSPCAKGAP
jgi:hypothetical protein